VLGTTAGDTPPAQPASDRRLLGARLREARKRRGIGVRELGRQTDCSASLISQIELGKIAPSVSTLYVLTSSLGVSMDSLFVTDGAQAGGPQRDGSPGSGAQPEVPQPNGSRVAGAADAAAAQVSATQVSAAQVSAGQASAGQASAGQASAGQASAGQGGEGPAAAPAPMVAVSAEASMVQRRHTRPHISLQHGVRWERLNPLPELGAEFLEVTYVVGGGSRPDDQAVRHNGREYGLVLEGVLTVQIGFESYVLQAGDSVAFDSAIPHRFWNSGDTPVRAVWFELKGDGSVPSEQPASVHGWH
jgi:quercetin dioxygenase-like cupin family protein/DNA-binding XRE family transcriptional regulator